MIARTGERERRTWRRRPPAECPWLGAVRLRPGRDVRVVDAASGGCQLETPVRLLPGASVDLRLLVFGTPAQVQGRVVRCRVAALRPRLLYRASIAFDDPLDLDESACPAPSTHHPPTAEPGKRSFDSGDPPRFSSP